MAFGTPLDILAAQNTKPSPSLPPTRDQLNGGAPINEAMNTLMMCRELAHEITTLAAHLVGPLPPQPAPDKTSVPRDGVLGELGGCAEITREHIAAAMNAIKWIRSVV